MGAAESRDGILSESALRRVDEACDAFEAVWRAGGRPRIEDYLGDAPGPERSKRLEELLKVELECRARAGERPGAEEYRLRLPADAGLIDALFATAPPGPGADGPGGAAPGCLSALAGRRRGGGEEGQAGSAPPDAEGAGPDVITRAGPTGLPARAGRYRIEGEIAHGGMGAVLRARDPDLNRTLAVKVLQEQYRGDPELERRFLEEAQVTGQLQHPGVPPVHEVGRLDDGRPFFAMKLIQGRTLVDLLQERREPSEGRPRWLAVFEQVCQAVAYAHSKGVLHRDLKPANVMVGAFGEVQVMDWGLAKVLNRDRDAARPPAPAATPAPGDIQTVRTATAGLSSQEGAVLGTYAYMAPEQALGQVDRLDERCDVFGLGAILCEVLTGQPPYAAPESWEVHLQAARGDLADAFARLGGCGADAELLRLAKACLAPQPPDRPRDAGVVAREATAYLASVADKRRAAEMEAARATARAQAERRARRLTAGLGAAVLLAVLLGGGGSLWLAWQRAERARAALAALEEAERWQGEQKWPEAREAAARAEGHLAGGGPDELRRRVRQVRANVDMVVKLEEIPLEQAEVFDLARAEPSYREAFRAYGLDVEGEDPAVAAARIGASAIRERLIAALDHWAEAKPRPDRVGRQRLLTVARLADPDPWRSQLRDAVGRGDGQALQQLADRAKVVTLPPTTLVLLGRALAGAGRLSKAVEVLQEGQRRHPGDFWLNQNLASSLMRAQPARTAEAVSFYRAALALRPHSPAVHVHLGIALYEQGELPEAVAAYRKALALKPDYAPAHNNFGLVLAKQGKLPGAVGAYQKAIAFDPKLALAYSNLGLALSRQGKLPEAVGAYQKAIAIKPDFAPAHNYLALALRRQGKLPEAVAAHRKAIELEPGDARAYFNLGTALEEKRDLDGAVAAYRKAIGLKPDDPRAHVNLGAALSRQGKLPQAVDAYQKAIQLKPDDALAYFNLGLALFGQGKLPQAVDAYQKAIQLKPDDARAYVHLGPALADQGKLAEAEAACRKAIAIKPDYAEAHCNLGHTLRERGDFRAALQALRRGHELGLRNPGWNYRSADWVKRCERMADLADRLPAILAGNDRPRGAAEQLVLADLCRQHTKLYAAAVRFYAAAFAEQPQLAEDLRQGSRYRAARAAALAVAGQGQDAGHLEDKERARLRQQALGWLRADLARWARLLEGGKPESLAALRRTLTGWQKEPDLAGLRDPEALARLPEAERPAWGKLWADVEALLARARDQGEAGPTPGGTAPRGEP
jgi:serine/threonine-protein kinase